MSPVSLSRFQEPGLSGRRALVVAAALAAAAAALCLAFSVQWRLTVFWVVFLPSAWLLFWGAPTLQWHPERLFVALALPIGLLMCLFMPAIVSVSWDGYAHYKVSNQIAQWPEYTVTEADTINYDMDGIYTVGLVPWGASDDDWHPNWRGVLTEEGMDKANLVLSESSEIVESEGASPLTWAANTVGRAPNAVGLWLGSALGLPYLGRLLLGRITNLLFYVALMTLAIRSLDSGKRILATIALAPTLLFEASNFSYDPFCIGMLALAAARFARELQRPDEPLTLSGALWILVPFLLGILIKSVFIPAGIFLVFMPRKKFASEGAHRCWLIACWAVAAAVLATFLVPFLSAGGEGYADARGGQENIDSAAQLTSVASNPLKTVLVLLLWGVTYLNPVAAFTDMLVNYCYLPSPVLWWLWDAIFWVALLWAVLSDREACDDGWPSKPLRLWGLVGIAGAYTLCALALYFNYNDVGSWFVLGMQVRYMLLFLALFLLVLVNVGTRGRQWVAMHVYPRLPGPIRPNRGAIEKATTELSGADPVLSKAWPVLVSLASWACIICGFAMRF